MKSIWTIAAVAMVALVFSHSTWADSVGKNPYTKESLISAVTWSVEDKDWFEQYFANLPHLGVSTKTSVALLSAPNFEGREVRFAKQSSGSLVLFLVPQNTKACNFAFVEMANNFLNRFPTRAQVYDAEVAHFEYAYSHCNLDDDPKLSVKIRYRYAKALKEACVFLDYWDCSKALELFRELMTAACREVGFDDCLTNQASFDKVTASPKANPLLEGTGVTVRAIWEGSAQVLQKALTEANNACAKKTLRLDQAQLVLEAIGSDALVTGPLREQVEQSKQAVSVSQCLGTGASATN